MSARKFDRFMVDVHISANPKIARLNPAERWCFVGGILSLAALSPVRGCLLIGDHAAEPADIASHARVSIAVARSALEKLRRVGMIVRDEDLDCERVHDFDDWNPAPKNDPTNAERQQRYRDRRAARNGTVTPVTAVTVTAPEVEGKRRGRESPPSPPVGGRARDTAQWKEEAVDYARRAGVNGDDETLCRAVEQATSFAKLKSPEEFRTFAAQHFESLTVEVAAA